jgi:transcriptional regulator with XRE-family HTH domain
MDDTFGDALHALRTEQGLSLRDLGTAAHLSKSYVDNLEKGHRQPTRETAASLDRALGGHGLLVQLVEAPLSMPMVEQAAALQRGLSDTLTSGPITDATLDEWEWTVARHGRATRYRPEADLLAELLPDIAALQRTLNQRHTQQSRRRLATATAQLAGLVALTLLKLGDGRARDWWRTGRQAATAADNRPVVAWMYAQEAYQLYYGGDLYGAVELAVRAQQLCGGGPWVADALAAPLEARAQARLGRRAETEDALVRAEAALGRLDAGDKQPSAFGYDDCQLAFHSGNAWTSLHDTERAWEHQQRALDIYPSENLTDRTLISLDRAACLVWDGDLASGAELAASTIGDLPVEHRSALILYRARDLVAKVPERHKGVRELLRLQEVLALPAGN